MFQHRACFLEDRNGGARQCVCDCFAGVNQRAVRFASAPMTPLSPSPTQAGCPCGLVLRTFYILLYDVERDSCKAVPGTMQYFWLSPQYVCLRVLNSAVVGGGSPG